MPIKMYAAQHVLSEGERRDFIKKSIPYLRCKKGHPAEQTSANLHLREGFGVYAQFMHRAAEKATGQNLKIGLAWVLRSKGRREDMNWHNHHLYHPYDYSLIYYMKSFRSGTLFREGFVKAKQNSLLIFPSEIEHTTPSSFFHFDRYTFSMDLSIC